MPQDNLVSALVGLAGACYNNPKTPQTDATLRRALTFPPTADPQDMLREVYAEKHAVSPGCATCAAPCGNTSDYDMRRLYEAPAEIRDLKLAILDRLVVLAADERADVELLYRGLCYLSYDLEAEALHDILEEMKKETQP